MRPKYTKLTYAKRNIPFILFCALFAGLAFLYGCQEPGWTSEVSVKEKQASPQAEKNVTQNQTVKNITAAENKTESDATNTAKPIEKKQEKASASCTVNADCPAGNVCIDGNCSKLSAAYATEACAQQCGLKEVTVRTSDGDVLVLPPGKGSYTAAGGLDWNVVAVPPFCKEDEGKILFRIVRKKGGQILNEEYITLRKGETSKALTHPSIKKLAFTLKAEDVKVECK